MNNITSSLTLKTISFMWMEYKIYKRLNIREAYACKIVWYKFTFLLSLFSAMISEYIL